MQYGMITYDTLLFKKMGIGRMTPSSDIMESSIVPEPTTHATRFRNQVYSHVRHHRELLGYPKGCASVPYMFVSNDLSGIYIEFMRLFEPHKKNAAIEDVKKDFMNLLNLLLLTYDEDPAPYYHSIEKEVFTAMHQALVALNLN